MVHTIVPFLKEKGLFLSKGEIVKRYLIQDVPVPENAITLFEAMGLTLLDTHALTRSLLAWKGWSTFDRSRTLLVFPGNGAEIVQQHMQAQNAAWLCRWPHIAHPFAKRIWIPGEQPQPITQRIAPNRLLLGFQHVVLIDDVISSGATVRYVRRNNLPWIPGAEWSAVAWIRQRAAAVKGFSKIFASQNVGMANTKVPVNSVSTLIAHPAIATSYANRNLGRNADQFIMLLNDLR